MYFKLIFRNVKRNIQTYIVYFLTLMFIYAILYGFNSISNHPVLQGMDNTKQTMANIMGQYMGLLSFVVMLAISFLVLYASNFVIQRRKKELGLYASLGMRNSKISLVLFFEILIINFLAFLVGLLLGIIFLCLLAKVALIIFDTSYNGTLIFFDYNSILLLLFTFFVSSIIIGALNYLKFKNRNIISLIQDTAVTSSTLEILEKNTIISTILFLCLTVGIIGSIAYISYYQNLMKLLNWGYILVPLFIIFVVLFYNLISRIATSLLSRFSRFYFSNLNSYKIRFLAQNTHRNSLTIAVLSITLTLAFSIVIIGGSTYSSVQEELSKSTPYNLTIIHSLNSGSDSTDILSLASNGNTVLKDSIKSGHQFTIYESEISYKDIINTDNLWSIDSELPETKVSIISVSDFNKLMELQNKKEIHLSDNEFAINCNYKGTLSQVKQFVDSKPIISISGSKLKYKQLTSETYFISSVGNNDRGTLIVPDSVLSSLSPNTDIYIANYKDGADSTAVTDYLTQWVEKYAYQTDSGLIYEYQFQTKDRLKSIYMGFMGTIIFIMSFVGIVFTILTLSILSIQSSTLALETKMDYEILNYLGSNYKNIRAATIQQNILYFMGPCIVAFPLSLAIGKSIINYFENFLNLSITVNLSYMLFMAILFFAYIILTNYICLKIIKSKVA